MAKGYHPLRRRSSDPIPLGNFSKTNNNSNSVPSSTMVNMDFLRSGQTLPINYMAIPVNPVSSGENVEVYGRLLFQHFIQEELVHQGISDEILEVENPPPDAFDDVGPEIYGGGDVRVESPTFPSIPDGYKNAMFTKLGANIRNIADEFAASHERKKIQQQADEVDLSHINYSAFQHMLIELFRDGINQFRIISLFYFCSDVLVRCIKNELHRLGSKLFFWALEYLVNNVCKWVRDHGGWGKVFSKMFTFMYAGIMLGAAVAVILGSYVYVKRNM